MTTANSCALVLIESTANVTTSGAMLTASSDIARAPKYLTKALSPLNQMLAGPARRKDEFTLAAVPSVLT
ncbi:hypothetical protein [Brooklawnia cerclae]|uniref:Uncharacterized protein n=1 Tax=Brooklawnia cerclae TaxID=349934 RepID=A0ABX0SNN2_9ACTN|nr:hypothetical protein [Brooklawnia cerclae]NIH58357.1 hypothetical protein [Brooklawnia cerclae]